MSGGVDNLGATYIAGAGLGASTAAGFSLVMQQGPQPGQIFPLVGGTQTIGRAPDNQIHIADVTISKQHAGLTVQPNGVFIKDMGSSNGTFVNGQQITNVTPLKSGDTLQIGTNVTLGVQGPGGAMPVQSAAGDRRSGGLGMIVAVVILLAAIGFGGAIWFMWPLSQFSSSQAEATIPLPLETTLPPAPTPTVTPTSVPQATITFNLDKDTVQLGQCATLRWKVTHAKEVRLDGEKVSAEGSHKVCPQEDTTIYRLTALSLEGETEEQAITLNVPPTPLPPPGVEIEFTAHQSTVEFGDCTTLHWQVKNANEVRRETKKVGLTGSEQVCPQEPNSTYTLLVQTLEGENIERVVTINVPPTPVPTALPTSTPKPQNPVIDKFMADQNALNQGSCTTLRWQVRNAQTVRLDGNAVANQGSQQVCPTASANTYNLVATGGGGSVQSSLTLVINTPTPTPVIVYVQPTPAPQPVSVSACVVVDNDGCYVYHWNIQGVQTLHFNGQGITSPGQSGQHCTFFPEAVLRITHRDGRVEEIRNWSPCY
ncbi:MAG: FHA domain-containing protein [Anaerolineae bacterium]|nr:FHA domain-containing protein [Anaerolineae bacterium]